MMKKMTILFLFLFYSGFLWASGKPEYEVTDILLVDDFEDGNNLGLMNGKSSIMHDQINGGNSVITVKYDESPGYGDSRYCALLEWKLRGKINRKYAGFYIPLLPDMAPLDLSGYYGLRFYAKGNGTISVHIGTEDTMKEYNHFNSESIQLKKDWVLYEIPFTDLKIPWGTPYPWNPAKALTIEWEAGSNTETTGFMYLDNAGFYKITALEPGKSKTEEETVKKTDQISQKKMNMLKDKRVAIVGLDSREIDESVSKAIIDFIINAFVNASTVKVIDRNGIQKILEEQQFQMKDYADTTKMIALGKLAGAEYIVTGSLSKVGEQFYLNVKLISVETAEIIGSSIATAQRDSEFFDLSNNVVKMLFE